MHRSFWYGLISTLFDQGLHFLVLSVEKYRFCLELVKFPRGRRITLEFPFPSKLILVN